MAQQSLFESAFIYLASAVVCVPLAKRFGLSAVLGYLVAGMAIGPFGFGLIGEHGEDVMHFAEFGVVMMLFLVGLELRPELLWKMRGPILGLGGAQVGITTIVIALVCLVFGIAWQMSLALGMALALSSTAIVLQSLQEKGLSQTTGGRSAFSVLLFQDIAVIPMLAIFPLLATIEAVGGGDSHGHGSEGGLAGWLSHQPGWVRTLMVLAAVALIVIAGRYLFRPILGAVARTRVRETFVALALLLVIGIALLMTMLGVSPALGTFLAGVVLANSEYRHELEADIEPFKGLLLGVFFISVGASIDFSLIKNQPGTIAGGVVGLIAVKAGILFALGRFAKLAMDQRVLFSMSLAQGGEFAFVLLSFAVGAGVVAVDLSQQVVAIVAVTMALTPLMFITEEKVLRPRFGTKEVEEREPDEMHEESPVILIGVGRFGNFVARMLRSQRINVTVIDHDSDHIDFLRKIGLKAFYGDAARHDLLEAAGAGQAKVLIIAVDDEETSNRLVESVQKHFPNLEIMARAVSRNHQYELINSGIHDAYHECAGSAMQLTEQVLVKLGYRAHRAARIAKSFSKQDRAAAGALAKVHQDEESYVNQVRERIANLEDMFSADERSRAKDVDSAWETFDLKADVENDEYANVVPAAKKSDP